MGWMAALALPERSSCGEDGEERDRTRALEVEK
jgi:hypothetical protein